MNKEDSQKKNKIYYRVIIIIFIIVAVSVLVSQDMKITGNFIKTGNNYSCTSCSDCTAAVEDASSGDIVYLTQDITNSALATCMNISADNVTLDCQGHTIDGDDSSGSYGIYTSQASQGYRNLTVTNCSVSDWGDGIYTIDADYLQLDYSNFSSNVNGISLLYSDYAIMNNVISENNTDWGFFQTASGYHNITNSKFRNNLGDIGNSWGAHVYNKFENVTGTGDLPIVYYDSQVTLENWNNNFSEIILYFADGSVLNNITLNRSNGLGSSIRIYDSDNLNVSNILINNTGIGFDNYYGDNINLTNSIFTNIQSGYALNLHGLNNQYVENVTASNSLYGMRLYDTNNGIIKNNFIINNTNLGLDITTWGTNRDDSIYNNFLNNTDNIHFTANQNRHFWNTTNQTGTRIFSDGTNIGGNYYANSSGTGFSETCIDADYDGFCDLAFNLTNEVGCTVGINCSVNNTDYLPLSFFGISNHTKVILESPVNGYSTFESITFNCSAYNTNGLDNMTLYWNYSGSWVSNGTNSLTGTRNSTTFTRNVSGNYDSVIWNCFGEGDGTTDWGDSNRSFWVNRAPQIEFVSPTPEDGATVIKNNVYVNVTTNDTDNYSAFLDWNRSLVGWWNFESYNSTGVFDNSSYNNFGEFNGGVGASNITSGIRGNALEFDGSNDYVDAGNDSSLRMNTTLTFSVWARRMGSFGGWQPVITKDNATRRECWFGFGSTNQIDMNIQPGYENIYGDTQITDTNWHHIVGVYNSTHIILYLDGQQDGTPTARSFQVYQGTGTVNIGHTKRWGYYFNGAIDEVMIFNRALSGQEIKALYDAGSYRLETNFTGLSDGDYNYTAYAIDSAGNINSSSRDVTIDRVLPIINLISPTNQSTYTSSSTVIFTYNVTDANPISNCSLILNGVVDQTDTAITKDTVQSFSRSLTNNNYNWSINCSDFSGNLGNTSVYDLTLSYVVPEEEEDSGSSGGGAPMLATTTSNDFEVEDDMLSIKLRQGEVGRVKFVIKNNIQTNIEVELESNLDILKVVNNISLGPEESREVVVDVIAKEDIAADIYIGKIYIRANGIESEVLISAEVVSKESLFDVLLDIPSSKLGVLPGKELSSKISLSKFIKTGIEDVLINYVIKDMDGNVLVNESDTRAVETTASFIKNINIPENLEYGEYVFYVSVNYHGDVASASSLFKVGRNYSLYYVMSIIILIGLVIAIIMIIKHRQKNKIKKKK